MRSRKFMQLIRSALLVAVLLLTQAAIASHVDLDDSHPAGDSCALCAGSSVLGTGNVGATMHFDSVAGLAESPLYRQSSAPEVPVRHFLARGPPAAS